MTLLKRESFALRWKITVHHRYPEGTVCRHVLTPELTGSNSYAFAQAILAYDIGKNSVELHIVSASFGLQCCWCGFKCNLCGAQFKPWLPTHCSPLLIMRIAVTRSSKTWQHLHKMLRSKCKYYIHLAPCVKQKCVWSLCTAERREDSGLCPQKLTI